jgi:hypothetical protein
MEEAMSEPTKENAADVATVGPEAEARMVSIWSWASLILGVYGVILMVTGLVRLASPPTAEAMPRMAHLHADLWWPVIMLVLAAGLWWVGRKDR